jgi:hypothetical protein
MVKAACVTNELDRLTGGGSSVTDNVVRHGEESEKRATCEKNGVSMEGEFLFSHAVGEFLREEVRVGSFRTTIC